MTEQGNAERIHRVFVLEDEPATQAQLVKSINGHKRLTVAGTASDVAGANAWLSTQHADVALIDLALPDGNGLDVIRRFAGNRDDAAGADDDGPRRTEFMVITVFGDEQRVVDAIAAGATGYLLKERNAAHVTRSILELLDGGSPISPSIARQLLKRFRPEPTVPAADRPSLSPRETEVLRMVVKGFSYQEIAHALELSFHTVTSHIQHIYRKLAVRSRGEAVFEALQLGLVAVKE